MWSGIVLVGKLGSLMQESIINNRNILYVCNNHSEAAKILFEKTNPSDALLIKASRGEHMEKVLEQWNKLIETKKDSS